MFQTLQVEVFRPVEEDWYNIGDYISSVNINKGETSALGTDSASDGIAQSCDISLLNGTQERLNPTLQKGKIEFVQEEQISISSSGKEFSLSNSNLRNINIFVQKTDIELADIGVSISEDSTKAVFSSTLEVGDTVYVSYTYLDKTADNPFNIHSGQYTPLLWENRLVRVNSIKDNSPRVHTQILEANNTTFEYATEFPSNYEIVPGTIKLTHIKGIPWDEFTSNWDTYSDVFNNYTREELQDFVSQNIVLTDSGNIKFLIAPPNENIEVMYQLVDKSDNRLLFEGYIDSISFDFGNIDISCLGKAKRLQEAFINPGTLREYSVDPSTTTVTDIREGIDHSPGIPMAIFIQNCLDDAFGAGEITFYTETDPNFSILDIAQNVIEYKTLWELIQDIAVARACFIGYLYNSETDAYELTFKDINRTGTESADHTLRWTEDMTKHNMDIDGSTLRNHIIVRYWDSEEGESGNQEEVSAVGYDSVVATSVSVTEGSYTVTSSGIGSYFSAGDYVILADSNTDTDTSLDENIIFGKRISVKRIESVSTDTLNIVSQIPFTEDFTEVYSVGSNIKNNGIRPAMIEEEKASLITREEEAKLFAKKLYLDTSKIFNLTNITTFVRHEIQPLDVVSIVDPNMETDTNGDTGERYYIESVKHTFDFLQSNYTTTIQGNSLRGRAGRQKIQSIQSRPGEWTPITSKKLGEFEKPTAPQNLTNTTGGLIAKNLTPRAYTELSWNKPRNGSRNLYYMLEWRESSTPSDYSEGEERKITNVQNLGSISERIIIEPNTDYNWRVTAYSLTNQKGVISNEKSFTSFGDIIPPNDITGLSVVGQEEGLQISFNPATENDFLAYEIYVRKEEEGLPTENLYTKKKITKSDYTTIKGLEPDKYYVGVIAYDTSGNKSDITIYQEDSTDTAVRTSLIKSIRNQNELDNWLGSLSRDKNNPTVPYYRELVFHNKGSNFIIHQSITGYFIKSDSFKIRGIGDATLEFKHDITNNGSDDFCVLGIISKKFEINNIDIENNIQQLASPYDSRLSLLRWEYPTDIGTSIGVLNINNSNIYTINTLVPSEIDTLSFMYVKTESDAIINTRDSNITLGDGIAYLEVENEMDTNDNGAIDINIDNSKISLYENNLLYCDIIRGDIPRINNISINNSDLYNSKFNFQIGKRLNSTWGTGFFFINKVTIENSNIGTTRDVSYEMLRTSLYYYLDSPTDGPEIYRYAVRSVNFSKNEVIKDNGNSYGNKLVIVNQGGEVDNFNTESGTLGYDGTTPYISIPDTSSFTEGDFVLLQNTTTPEEKGPMEISNIVTDSRLEFSTDFYGDSGDSAEVHPLDFYSWSPTYLSSFVENENSTESAGDKKLWLVLGTARVYKDNYDLLKHDI